MNKNAKKKRKGFTLIELIIVLAIMAIIAAIAVPNFSAVRDNSRKKADQQSCETIKRTVLMLVSDGTVKSADRSFTFTKGGVAPTYTNAATDWTDAGEKTAIENALAEVKVPSASDGVKYTITFTAAGKITVKTDTTGVTTN